jgi:hypothetical protein
MQAALLALAANDEVPTGQGMASTVESGQYEPAGQNKGNPEAQ